MSDNNTITITITRTYPVYRCGDRFAAEGWMPRTRDEWAYGVAEWGDSTGRDIARAMVAYIDSLPENQPPTGYGFVGTLDVDGVVYDVIRDTRGDYVAISRTRNEYLVFPHGTSWTSNWSDILAAGRFKPRSDA